MANSRKGPALGSVLRRTSSGSAAHAVSVGQRRWNRSAARTCWALRPRALTWAAKAAATPASAGALAGAGSIELGAHVRGGEVDVSGDGIDVLVAHQRLDDGKVDAGLGQRGAEGVAQRVGVSGRDPGSFPVIAEDGAQPGRTPPHLPLSPGTSRGPGRTPPRAAPHLRYRAGRGRRRPC